MFLKKKVGRRVGRVGALEGSSWLSLSAFPGPHADHAPQSVRHAHKDSIQGPGWAGRMGLP